MRVWNRGLGSHSWGCAPREHFFLHGKEQRILKTAVSWDVTPCGSCKNRHFGGTYRLHYHGDKNRWSRKSLAVTSNRSAASVGIIANVVTSSPILLTPVMEAVRSSETLVLTRATRCNIPGDGSLCIHRRENLKFYIKEFYLPWLNALYTVENMPRKILTWKK
jgi:hypothetical protein